MTARDLDRLVAVVSIHREELNEENVCICGYHGNWPNHLADVLAAAGVTMPTSEQRGDGCTHNHITMEIHLPSRGKNLFFGVAFNDDHIDEEHIAMWWDDTLGRLKQTAMETLEREGILESVEP